jgi:hypothetical protein
MFLARKIEECSAYFEQLHLHGWCFDPTDPAAVLTLELSPADGSTAVGASALMYASGGFAWRVA